MAKRGTPPKRPSERRRRPSVLIVAWALLILGIGGFAAWRALAPAEPPPAAPEPFFIVLEPPPPPEPPPAPTPPPAPPTTGEATPPDGATPAPEAGPAAQMPAMGPNVEVPQLTARPPQDTARGTLTGGAGGLPAPPRPRPEPGAAAAPQPDNAQVATAVAPPSPMGPQPSAVPPPPQVAPGAPVPAWQKFASPFDPNDPRPRIAVVVIDLGLSSAATEAAIQNLPAGVTLGFSPYADNLDNWINLARAGGHEVLLGLPMEPANFPSRDPGPRALLTSLSPRENLDRLDWVLGRVTGYVGVTNNMGSRFTASEQALRPVLMTLRDRGLMFVDARTTPRSVATGLASSIGLPRAVNDRWVDQEASRAAIDAMLADVERVAKQTGNAVAMGQPYPVTFERLAAWLPTLEGKGFAVAPITALINRQPDQ